MRRTAFRPYRVLRVVIAVGRVLPRYLVLGARTHSRQFAPDAAAWDRVHTTAARQLRDLAHDLGGGFTKAAQVAGARVGSLPAPFIQELSRFHDAAPPRSIEALRGVAERDLGSSLEANFRHVEPQPIGAASLAQVHRAQLHDGAEVVIKIQYPEVRRIIPLDLGAVRLVVGIVRLFYRRIDLRSLSHEIARYVELELDYRREVASMRRLGALLSAEPDVVVPTARTEYCGDHVIVMDFVRGIQVAKLEELRASGHQPAEVARRVAAVYATMLFEHGFFQADPHPGNLLVLTDGRIGLLDYGLCKQLPDGFVARLAQLIVCGLGGDDEGALRAAASLGFRIEHMEVGQLRAVLLLAFGRAGGERSPLEVLGSSRVPDIPEDVALVARTLLLLNGLSQRLAPGEAIVETELLSHIAACAASATSTNSPDLRSAVAPEGDAPTSPQGSGAPGLRRRRT